MQITEMCTAFREKKSGSIDSILCTCIQHKKWLINRLKLTIYYANLLYLPSENKFNKQNYFIDFNKITFNHSVQFKKY